MKWNSQIFSDVVFAITVSMLALCAITVTIGGLIGCIDDHGPCHTHPCEEGEVCVIGTGFQAYECIPVEPNE
jgi:hypothetical protein